MFLTEEQHEIIKANSQTIEEMAYLLFPPSLIAINLEIDEIGFEQEITEVGSVARNSFYKGYVRQLIAVRKSMVKAAHNGSTPQLDQVSKLINELSKTLPI